MRAIYLCARGRGVVADGAICATGNRVRRGQRAAIAGHVAGRVVGAGVL